MRIGTVPDRPRLRRVLAVLGPGIYGGSVLVLAVTAGWVVASVVGQHREELVRVSPRDLPAGWPPAAAILVGVVVGVLGLLLARAVGRRPSARRRPRPAADPGVGPDAGEETEVDALVAEPAEAAVPEAASEGASVTGVEAADVVGDVGSSAEISSDQAGRPAMAGVSSPPPPTDGRGEDVARPYRAGSVGEPLTSAGATQTASGAMPDVPMGSRGTPGPASGAPVQLASAVPAPPGGGPLSLSEDREEGPLVLFDRRLTRRVEYDAPARLQWDGHDLAGRVVDVAMGGAQLRLSGTSTGATPTAPSIGATIRATLRLEGTPVVVSGTVVWARRDHSDRLFGVQWFGLSPEPEQLLRRIVLGTPAA